MSDRKLAHVEKIEWIREISGADKIELVGILGWQCVIAKKDNFKVGEKIIYVEVDSVMPEKPEYEFLRDRKFRVKTIKLRGELSQGLVLPLHVLFNPLGYNHYDIGEDVTEKLGITKYLSPTEREELNFQERKIFNEKNKLKKFMMRYSWFRSLFLKRNQKQSFPYWVSKTDEERIQNIPHVLEQFKDKKVYITEKVDGQSATFTGKMLPRFLWMRKLSPKQYKFIVCSRNFTVGKDSVFYKTANKYNIEKILKKHPTLTIQGEQCGPKIQGNKYKFEDIKLFVFNIFDHEKNYYYNYAEMEKFCEENSLDIVQQVAPYNVTLSELGDTVQDIIELSKNKSVYINIPREGIVVRCIEKGKKLMSWKCVNPLFLLQYDDRD
jgi:hypothetical protein